MGNYLFADQMLFSREMDKAAEIQLMKTSKLGSLQLFIV